MAKSQVYVCTKHGGEVPRELLTVKKILFTEMGAGGRTQRARVVAWLCPECVAVDPDFNLPKFKAPGALPNKDLRHEPA